TSEPTSASSASGRSSVPASTAPQESSRHPRWMGYAGRATASLRKLMDDRLARKARWRKSVGGELARPREPRGYHPLSRTIDVPHAQRLTILQGRQTLVEAANEGADVTAVVEVHEVLEGDADSSVQVDVAAEVQRHVTMTLVAILWLGGSLDRNANGDEPLR